MTWTWVIFPFSFSSSSSSPPGSVSFAPVWFAPTTAHMWAWQVSYSTPKLVFPFARTASTSCMISLGLLNANPGSNSQQMFMPKSAAILLALSHDVDDALHPRLVRRSFSPSASVSK